MTPQRMHSFVRALRLYVGSGISIALLSVGLFAVGLAAPAAAQSPAPSRAETTDASQSATNHSPHGALWRAAAVPGWGQYYNRQYYKIPVVYAGLGGLTTFAVLNNLEYLRFRHAYLYRAWQDKVDAGDVEANPYAHYASEYDDLAERYPSVTAGPLRSQRDIFRRNRDLLYIGVGLFYMLSILDAYVSAHLLDFDVSEDLSLGLHTAPAPGLRATLRF